MRSIAIKRMLRSTTAYTMRSSGLAAYFDMIKLDDYEQYLCYVEQHLPGAREESFDVIPIGFSPFPLDMEGIDM